MTHCYRKAICQPLLYCNCDDTCCRPPTGQCVCGCPGCAGDEIMGHCLEPVCGMALPDGGGNTPKTTTTAEHQSR